MPEAIDIGRIARLLLLPPAPSLLLAALGLALLRRRPRPARIALAVGVASAWLFATPLVGDALVRLAEAGQRPLDEATWQAARDGARPPGAIVVLGGGLSRDGPFEPRRERLQERTLQRVVAGARIARATGLPVLVSGGITPRRRSSEADLMRQVLEADLGVKVRWVEDRSRDTAENAALSAAQLRADGIDSVVLVTHAIHMPRARRTFEAAGLAVLPAPHDWRAGPWLPSEFDPSVLWPSADGIADSWYGCYELLGRIWYRLRGRA